MKYAQVLADIEARQAEWRKQDDERAAKHAAIEAQVQRMHMLIQHQNEQFGNAMLYLMLNPDPTPEAFGAILGREPRKMM